MMMVETIGNITGIVLFFYIIYRISKWYNKKYKDKK